MLNWTDKYLNEAGKWLVCGVCLAADEKPTEGLANGSALAEMDTGKLWLFDEEGGTWHAWGE